MSPGQPAGVLIPAGHSRRLPDRLVRLARNIAGRLLVADPLATGASESREHSLVRQAASGDHDAFEALIAPRTGRMIATARKILRDPDAADDATQQALVSAWRTLPRLRDPDRLDAWLTRLLVNACYTEARRRRRFDRRVSTLEGEPSTPDGSDQLADRSELEAAFVALSPEHRAVVVLRHYLDLPLAEVAAIVGVAPGTARSRLHYALRALRASLEAAERPHIEEVER